MSAAKQSDSAEPISLERAKVVHVDREVAHRTLLEDTLREIGFRRIATCDSLGQFAVMLGVEKPDIVFLDIDAEPDVAFQTIRAIRNGEVGECPFVVVVALTQRPELEAVRAALGAGSDDMIVKPVTARALRQRMVNQIDDRKGFIATDDYVGPDRRAEDRELTEDDLASIQVPNGLRHAATGDESAAPSEERVREILRSLSVQKFYLLSSKIGRVAGQQRDLLAGNAKSVDSTLAMQEISEALAEIDKIIGEQNFQSVVQVVASTRQAMEDLKGSGNEVTPRQFELLRAHGDSIGVVLKESDETAGVLVSALEKAVTAVKASPCEPKAESAAGEAKVQGRSADQDRKPQPPSTAQPAPAAQRAKFPPMVRFKAWWNGVDPQDIITGATE